MALVRLRLTDDDRPDEPAKEFDAELTEAEEADARRVAEASADVAAGLRALDAGRTDGVLLTAAEAAESMGVPVLELREPPRRAVPHAVVSRSALEELTGRVRNGDADAKGALAAFTFLALPDDLYKRVRELAEAVKRVRELAEAVKVKGA